jgi:hypothetical protein
MSLAVPHATSHRLSRHQARAWVWLLVFAWVLQGAAPLLAAFAASSQGVAVAEICSVYGMRLVAANEADDHNSSPLSQAHGGNTAHCPLASLLAGLALPPGVSAVELHAPAGMRLRPVVVRATYRIDASRRWLARRLHAPPAVLA